ncbi:MAG: methylmalonyl-CoA mutase family protein [Bacillota bacterium]
MASLSKAMAQWDRNTARLLEKAPEAREEFLTDSLIRVDRLYTPLDLGGMDYEEAVGFPGEYPYTRGVYPTMYRGRAWTPRQYSGYATAQESNRRYKHLLEQGQRGLSVAFDLPTQMGYDSDHPLALGEVGRVGVAIDSVEDMEALFEGIPMDQVTVSMTINAPAAVLLAMYLVAAERKGIPPGALDGTIQNDILKEYLARGTYIFPVGPSMRLLTDTFAYCFRHVPKWNVISIGAYHIREAGSTAVQEVAFAFANAIAYIEAALAAGLDIDDFGPRISWIFNTTSNFFEEVSKYRAARRLWARIMRERFGARDPRSMMLRIHIQTGGSMLTAQQPLVNLIRGTIQALASVLGGTQSLAVSSYDEALCIPTEESATLSLRVQQVIAHESGVADTVDPLGGSYYVEALTNRIEEEAMQYIERIDRMGGAPRAIELGYMQGEIEASAYRYQKEVEAGTRVIVGLNRFRVEEEPRENMPRVDPDVRGLQVLRLTDLKRRRDGARVERVLLALGDAARGYSNLMGPVMEAVRSSATLGEICGVFREVFGEYRPSNPASSLGGAK